MRSESVTRAAKDTEPRPLAVASDVQRSIIMFRSTVRCDRPARSYGKALPCSRLAINAVEERVCDRTKVEAVVEEDGVKDHERTNPKRSAGH